MGHAIEPIAVEFRSKEGRFRIGAGGIAQEQQDRRDERRDLDHEAAPARNDSSWIAFDGLELIGALFGGDGSFARECLLAKCSHKAAPNRVIRCMWQDEKQRLSHPRQQAA